MFLINTIVCIIFAIMGWYINKNIYNPQTIFNCWWGLVTFLSGFGLYGINVPGLKIYAIMFLGIITYNFCCILFAKGRKNRKVVNTDHLNIKIYAILQIITFIFLFPKCITVLKLLGEGMPYSYIRMVYFETNQIMNVYEVFINKYIIQPFLFVSILVIAIEILRKIKNKKIIIISIVNILLNVFMNGGRTILFQLVIIALFSFLIERKKVNISAKAKKNIKICILLIISVMILTTFKRATNVTNIVNELVKNIVLYFTGPIAFFEQCLTTISSTSELMYGQGFFSGLIEPFTVLYSILTNGTPYMPANEIGIITQNAVLIGKDIYYNAYPTMFFTFLKDFGILGIFIDTMIFGSISMIVYNYMEKYNTNYSKAIYLTVIFVIIFSTMWWVPLFTWVWVVIFVLKFCYMNKKIKK